MDIQNRINKIKDYFVEMNVAENVIYVTIAFPNEKWIINDNITSMFPGVKIVKKNIPNKNQWFIFAEYTIGFDTVFDAAEFVVNENKNAQAKLNLLIKKMDELKSLFQTEDIDTLKTLQFKYKKKKPHQQIKKNDTNEECNFMNTCEIIEEKEGACNVIEEKEGACNVIEEKEGTCNVIEEKDEYWMEDLPEPFDDTKRE